MPSRLRALMCRASVVSDRCQSSQWIGKSTAGAGHLWAADNVGLTKQYKSCLLVTHITHGLYASALTFSRCIVLSYRVIIFTHVCAILAQFVEMQHIKRRDRKLQFFFLLSSTRNFPNYYNRQKAKSLDSGRDRPISSRPTPRYDTSILHVGITRIYRTYIQ